MAEHASEILKAIAHPVRLQIVELLQAKDMCVGDIVDAHVEEVSAYPAGNTFILSWPIGPPIPESGF